MRKHVPMQLSGRFLQDEFFGEYRLLQKEALTFDDSLCGLQLTEPNVT
jgi:hypothetical protein